MENQISVFRKMTTQHRTQLQIFALIALAVLLLFVTRQAVDEVRFNPTKSTASGISIKQQIKARMDSIQKARATPAEQNHALQDLLAGRPFVLLADGRPRRFTLSLSELYLTTAATNQRYKQVGPLPDAKHLIQATRDHGLETTGWVLYPEGSEGKDSARHILHKRLLIQSVDRDKTVALLPKHGLKLVDEPDYSPGSLIVEPLSGGPEAALRALEQLNENPSIRFIGPLLLRQLKKFSVPNDTLFSSQWHLKNTGQGGGTKGADMGVTSVWDTYKGQGIKIAIVDDGLQILHPDLAPNADTANHYDWNDFPKDTNPAPSSASGSEDFHGTSVGGVAAARGNNNLGVSGVAPEATLVGFRLIADTTTDQDDAEAMTRGKDVIQIKNNSWGYYTDANELAPAPLLFESARRDAALTGRGGKGTLFVWASGNDRADFGQGQKDGSTNSMYVLAVGATTNKGALADYSETGSHLVVTAPSNGGSRSIVTTDLLGRQGYNQFGTSQGELSNLDYTNDFGGTSSATPAVSGAIALMLEANPDLSWRDVKEILLRSSKKLSPTSTGWVSRNGGNPSLPLIKHHQSFGGGGINVQAAVTLAETWIPLGTMLEKTRSFNAFQPIPDDKTQRISIPFDFSSSDQMRVEHARLTVDIRHPYRGDLEIQLISPTGVASTLASAEARDFGNDYEDWIFSSVRHWGEAAKGTWILTIKDLAGGDNGQLNSASLTLYGTDAEEPVITSYTDETQLLKVGQSLNLHATTTGGGNLYMAWLQNLKPVEFSNSLSIPIADLSHAGRYQFQVMNVGGNKTTDSIYVGLVNENLPATIINLGEKGSVTVGAAGEGLIYEWRRNGLPIPTGGKFTGMNSKTLNISNIQPEDATGYTCIVRMSGIEEPIETLPLDIEIRFKPVVTPRSIPPGLVSGVVNEQILAINGTTRFSAKGLPSGVTISSSGLLQGRPNKQGTYKIRITATNLAGSSQPVDFEWLIEEFPTSARGTWSGIVERQSTMNADMGGRVRLSISNTGTYSGSITMGSKSYSWSGRVNALLNNADSTTPIQISRGRSLTALSGTFTLKLATGELSGSLADGASTTTFEAVRNPWPWLSRNEPALASAAYNAALELPVTLLQNADYPQGHGHTRLTVSKTGTVSWAGKLADATTLTGSTTLGLLGQTGIHAMLYSNTGSTQGWSKVTLATDLVDGTLDWVKNAQSASSKTRSYKAGIPLHSLTVRGAKYTRPISPAMMINLDAQPDLGPLVDNAKLRFSGLPLTAPLEQRFKVTKTNTANVSKLNVENPQSIRLSLSASTGALSGSFTFRDDDPFDTVPPFTKITRSANYSGLLITRPDLNRGVGYFNLPELPDTFGEKSSTTPVISGKVELIKFSTSP